jgi:hypothetical protein
VTINLANITSPLAPILMPVYDVLPVAFRQQFLTPPGENLVLVEGTMQDIWYPAWLTPVFWLLSAAGILVPTRGHAVPTTLEVIPQRDESGRPQQAWNRTFRVSTLQHSHFNTVVIYDENIGYAVDLVGPGHVLYLAWDAQFIAPATLTIRRTRCALRFGTRLLWLPQWLWPLLLGRERFQQTVDPDQTDLIHIELIIGHPVLGDIFVYRGAFRVSVERQ